MSALVEPVVGAPPELERRIAPQQRLELLCDPGTVHVFRSYVRSPVLGAKARPGDGVVAASGRIDGRPVLCYAQDSRFAGGSLGAAGAETIVRLLEQADRALVPVIALVESGGARMQEGVAALSGYARIFRGTVALSGRVPQISVLTGVSAGGGCYGPALTDFTILAKSAAMFLTGPGVVHEVCGEQVTARELGGSAVQERNGVCHLVAPTHVDAILQARELLAYLPQNAKSDVPMAPPEGPLDPDPGAAVPANPRQVYDVRNVLRGLLDGGRYLEIAPKWARNMVTAFGRIDGRSVGIIANQPRVLGGVIDCDASTKGARFVRTCDAFGIPLVVLVDTPGYMPGTKMESAGIIRHGAKLLHAFAAATVPTVTVVLRKSYGGAFISMNSKDLGADAVFAWPDAEIGIMAARQAVNVIHRRALRAGTISPAELDALTAEYERELSATAAACTGCVDEIVEPRDTRRRVSATLETLSGVRARRYEPSNIPL